MSSGRPRRSVAGNTSYQIQFPALPGSSDEESDGEESSDDESGEDSEHGEEEGKGNQPDKGDAGGEMQVDEAVAAADPTQGGSEAGPSNAACQAIPASKKPKKTRKKRVSSSPEPVVDIDSSGSEYAPEVIKGKDGQVVEVVPSEEESDDEEEALEPEDDDNDSAAGEKDLDDISIATSAGLSEDSEAGKQGLKHGRGSRARQAYLAEDTKQASTTSNEPGIRVVGRTPLAILNSTVGIQKKAAPRRKAPGPLGGPGNPTRLYDFTYGPVVNSPRQILSRSWDDPVHSSASQTAGGIQTTEALLENQRIYDIKRISYLPFGPLWDACEDYSFHKGKYRAIEDEEEGSRTIVRSTKWGGWYSEIPLDLSKYSVVQDISEILPYLPKNVYPSIPSAIHLHCIGKPDSDKFEENDAEDEMWAPDVPTNGNASGGLPMDFQTWQSNTSVQNSAPGGLLPAPNATSGPDRDSIEDDGVFRLSVGPIGDIVVGDETASDPSGRQKQVELERFTSMRLDSYLPEKPGHLLNAGGPVFGLDWAPQADDEVPAPCEYLAVSTVSEHPSIAYRLERSADSSRRSGLIQIWSLDTSIAADFGIAIDAERKGSDMRLELAMLVGSEMVQLQWCPKGGNAELTLAQAQDAKTTCIRLGLLAALSADGMLEIYDVPRPESARKAYNISEDDLVFMKVQGPLLALNLGVPIACFEWLSDTAIVAACSNGYVAVFHIEESLTSRTATVGPSSYFWMHEAPIKAIAVIRQPSLDREGKDRWDQDPLRIATSSLDGSTKMVDLQDTATIFNFGHERATRATATFQAASGGILFGDQDLGIRYTCLRMRDLAATTRVISTTGPTIHIASSDFHSFFAAATADGTCSLASTIRRMKRAGHGTHFLNKLYRIDFNRKTGAFRMLDNLMPDPRIMHEGRAANTKKKKGVQEEEDQPPDTLAAIAWPPEVAVNRAVWSKSIRKAHVLASGMACGLVRVDVVTGAWSAEVPPNMKNNVALAAGAGDVSN